MMTTKSNPKIRRKNMKEEIDDVQNSGLIYEIYNLDTDHVIASGELDEMFILAVSGTDAIEVEVDKELKTFTKEFVKMSIPRGVYRIEVSAYDESK